MWIGIDGRIECYNRINLVLVFIEPLLGAKEIVDKLSAQRMKLKMSYGDSTEGKFYSYPSPQALPSSQGVPSCL